jgi:hypothetical protein
LSCADAALVITGTTNVQAKAIASPADARRQQFKRLDIYFLPADFHFFKRRTACPSARHAKGP